MPPAHHRSMKHNGEKFKGGASPNIFAHAQKEFYPLMITVYYALIAPIQNHVLETTK